MNTNRPIINPIITTTLHLFSLILLLSTSVTNVLAKEANSLPKQPELKENSSEQKSVIQEKRNKDDDKRGISQDRDDDDDDDDDDNDDDDKDD
ncbi:hypothetical protein IQ264_06165 [Phormidium sp. LEGE 05292]|uniref:hypothetical protein n=1 Tax=[Phormidium] sp. LEGE 05292 TaxID=767427 RepID=UPI00187EDF60|nr:hypothetical protein [Phormidium sp. LEGE 05292]MBE9225019.1 hypothetical protein [Phormidium sp. LEGE 05292]